MKYSCIYMNDYICMYVCMYACMHVCMYACMHVCRYARMHVCMYACMHACMHLIATQMNLWTPKMNRSNTKLRFLVVFSIGGKGYCLQCVHSKLLLLIIEGSLEVKLPTIWRGGEARVREEKSRSEKIREKWEERRCRCAKKVGESPFTAFFPMICGSGGSKSRLAKAAGAEPSGQMRDEKLHAVVARSTFPSQNVQSTPTSDHFWKLRCWKSAHRCGAKHISKSKCTKHTNAGPLWQVEMSKKCTPLWREAHFQVKMYKTHQCRTTLASWDVKKVHAVWSSDVEKVHID